MVAMGRMALSQWGQRKASRPWVRFSSRALYLCGVSVSSAGAPQHGLRFERLDWTWAPQRMTLTHVR
jgi:hypothetical protein